MTPRRARRFAVPIGALSAALLLGTIALMYVDRHADVPTNAVAWSVSDVLDNLVNLCAPVLGVLLVVRRPENRIGWLFLLVGLTLGVGQFTAAYATHALVAAPGSLPGGELAGYISNLIWAFPFIALVLLFLWFPTGEVPSRRWRWLERAALAVLGLLFVVSAIGAAYTWKEPFSGPNTPGGMLGAFLVAGFTSSVVALPCLILASFVSAVMRYRRSRGDERLQLKWFATGAAFTAVAFAISIPLGGQNPVLSVLLDVGLAFTFVAIRDRDPQIPSLRDRRGDRADRRVRDARRVHLGGVRGARDRRRHAGRQPAEPAAVGRRRGAGGVAFQPVRQRARRLANRVVYGHRATPYQVLADFTARASETYSTEDVLPRMAHVVADGVGADAGSRVAARRIGAATGSLVARERVVGARAGPRRGRTPRSPFPDRERGFPVLHAGELLGAISVVAPPGDPLAADRERLLADVAAQAALVLRNVRLIEELRESRRRIVTAQDERAKALERNLHDGAQQQLVALAVKQRLAESMVERDPVAARTMLRQIQADTQEALDTLRDLARGIYPPLLADKGLVAALEARPGRLRCPWR
jgi:signal transduction histidine kinase